jgi:hypothetical protein
VPFRLPVLKINNILDPVRLPVPPHLNERSLLPVTPFSNPKSPWLRAEIWLTPIALIKLNVSLERSSTIMPIFMREPLSP